MITSIKAYAKINLALNVYDRLENGYHNIDMITIPLSLHDTIELESLPKGYGTFITSDDASLPTDESNLSNIALNKFKTMFPFDRNFLIHIYKRIPMSAGLGGGSADAAAVINALRKKLKISIDDDKLISLSSSIGGDVAFCLFNKPARCRGIGEKLEFITLKKKYYVLLIKPHQGVSTKDAYETFDTLDPKPELSNIDVLIDALENGNDEVIAKEMKNSLQPSAIKFVPEINRVIETLKNDGFEMTMMSGSGSTIFAMSPNYRALLNESKKFDSTKYTLILTTTL